MEISRKSFISGVAAGLAGMTLLPSAAFGAAPEDPDGGAHALRRSVGETFYARGGKGVLVPLVLERAAETASKANAEQFSLIFSADEGYLLKEGTWTLVSSDGQRRYEVFLVPAGTEASGRQLLRRTSAFSGRTPGGRRGTDRLATGRDRGSSARPRAGRAGAQKARTVTTAPLSRRT